MPLALYGMFAQRRRWRRDFPLFAYVLLYMITVVAFFVSSRHRLPVVPVCILFATAGFFSLLERVHRRAPDRSRGKRDRPERPDEKPDGRTRSLGPTAALLLVLLLGINPHARPAGTIRQFHNFEAVAWMERGDEAAKLGLGSAEADYEKAVEAAPDNAAAQYQLGVLLGKAGRFAQAEAHLLSALAATPDDPVINYNIALTYYYEGKLAEARTFLRRAEERGAQVDPALKQTLFSSPPP
jgi:hypothetical protein